MDENIYPLHILHLAAHPSFCLTYTAHIHKTASEDHYMSNTVCAHRHTKAGSSPGPVAGIKGELTLSSVRPFVCPPRLQP